jgi:hypothetical protein
MQVRAPVVVHVKDPGLEVTVYPVTAGPPLVAGAVHDTLTWELPGVVRTDVGAAGAGSGVVAEDGAEVYCDPVEKVTVDVKV